MQGKSYNAELSEKIAAGEENLFWALEAAGEQIGSTWGALHRDGYTWPERKYVGQSAGQPGEVIYHLSAVEMYVQDILNQAAALLPDLYAASEGDMEALARMRPVLEKLARWHQERWEQQ